MRTLPLITGGLWLVSLFLPAAYDASSTPTYGYDLLISGWAAILAGDFAWLANVLVVFVALEGARPLSLPSWLRLCSALAVSTFALEALDFTAIPDGYVIARHGSGYFAWLGAAGLSIVWHLARALSANREASIPKSAQGAAMPHRADIL